VRVLRARSGRVQRRTCNSYDGSYEGEEKEDEHYDRYLLPFCFAHEFTYDGLMMPTAVQAGIGEYTNNGSDSHRPVYRNDRASRGEARLPREGGRRLVHKNSGGGDDGSVDNAWN
jgi:hypothetical protein